MDTVRAFQLDVNPIQSYLAKCDAPFETSPLYSTETETSYVDTDRRKSLYRTIVDPALFSLVEDLMKTINEGDDEYQYVLWKNGSDITHIKYEEGGFFKAHRDFNSTTSNMIEEFSLIVCVTPEEEAKCVEGGETAIITFGGVGSKPVEKVYDTKTPGCALLFRKDLNHEGKPLIKGVKHIITANIFAVKKDQSEQVLYVTFPQEGVVARDDQVRTTRSKSRALVEKKDKAAANAAIMQVANDSKSYALPVSLLTGMLESHVRFSNSQAEAEGKEPPQVVPFVCKDFTFEQFGVVARILNRCYVDEASITKSKTCLDYFGPFNVSNVLVDLALEPSSEPPPVKRPKQEVEPKAAADDFDSDIIVCENESRMKAVLNTARAFNQPFVPFKILFIEGMLHSFDGDGDGQIIPFDIPMTAAAAFIGDHNNVFALWSLDQYFVGEDDVFTLKKAHECSRFFECAPEDHKDHLLNLPLGSKVELFEPPPGANISDCDIQFKVTRTANGSEAKEQTIDSEEFMRGGMGLGLNVRVSDLELKSGLLKYMFNKQFRWDTKPLDLRAGLTEESSVVHPVNDLFHLDGKGKACFTREQAKLASDYIASIDLERRVKASLNKKRFELPQVSEKVSMVYCNDDRYGKMNVLWVCGVLRLEVNDTKASALVSKDSSEQEKFDAWPSREAKNKISHAFDLADKYDNIVQNGGELPDNWWEYDSDATTTLLYPSDEEGN